MQTESLYDRLTRDETLVVIDALRKALIRVGIVTILLSIGGYYAAEPVLTYLQRITGVELVAYGLPDIFFSFLKLALAMGVTAGMPYTLYALIGLIPTHFPSFSRRHFFLFWMASILLFGFGVFFCLRISLPYGIQFLLSFETSHLAAAISVKKFISFCLLMILGFGFIFELPLVMMLLARIGLINAKQLAGYRRYAILVIFIISAVITPTPDVFNLLLMAVPLYLLFEMGLLGMRFFIKP